MKQNRKTIDTIPIHDLGEDLFAQLSRALKSAQRAHKKNLKHYKFPIPADYYEALDNTAIHTYCSFTSLLCRMIRESAIEHPEITEAALLNNHEVLQYHIQDGLRCIDRRKEEDNDSLDDYYVFSHIPSIYISYIEALAQSENSTFACVMFKMVVGFLKNNGFSILPDAELEPYYELYTYYR